MKKQQLAEKIENIRSTDLEFTYNLGDKFKIDIEAAKQRKEQIQEESKKNFEELKQQMMQKSAMGASMKSPIGSNSQKVQSAEEVDDDDQIADEVDDEYKDDFEGDDFYADSDDEEKKKEEDKIEEDYNEDGGNSEDIDLDYSQTHLEDFLKS